MRCPKCGQEMIHINNQYICTACGIVANEFSPKQQILGAIKQKMAAQNTAKQEEYVSPVAIATEKPQAQQDISTNPVPKIDQQALAGITLDQIIKELAAGAVKLNKGTTDKNAEDYLDSGSEGEKVIPRIGTEGKEVASQESEASQKQIQPPPASVQVVQPVQPEAAQVENVAPANMTFSPPLTSQDTMGSLQVSQVLESDQEEIYPSHQVNPILIKTLIYVFVALVLFVIGYLIYTNPGARGFIDNTLKNLGK